MLTAALKVDCSGSAQVNIALKAIEDLGKILTYVSVSFALRTKVS